MGENRAPIAPSAIAPSTTASRTAGQRRFFFVGVMIFSSRTRWSEAQFTDCKYRAACALGAPSRGSSNTKSGAPDPRCLVTPCDDTGRHEHTPRRLATIRTRSRDSGLVADRDTPGDAGDAYEQSSEVAGSTGDSFGDRRRLRGLVLRRPERRQREHPG
jgi:hypothetical protein